MSKRVGPEAPGTHEHVFLGVGHEKNERKTWAVIVLCSAMMLLEIVGGSLFGSLALVADGLHMSTHAGAMLIAALAYTYARRHARDPRFVFGTGKLGDLAGYTSAIVLAMIAVLIGYEAVVRFLSPVPIHFTEAIPIAVLGLFVNIMSAWLLSGHEHHDHAHGHSHSESDQAHDHEHAETRWIDTPDGVVELGIAEDTGVPRFRLKVLEHGVPGAAASLVTIRPGGPRQVFDFVERDGYLESGEIPEPHTFRVILELGSEAYDVAFEEAHEHHSNDDHEGAHSSHRDHNIRSAYVHVMADAAVSVLAIVGLSLAWTFGWNWMDPLAGVVGALVIANWSYRLIRDTGGVLLDVNPDRQLTARIRAAIERDGDRLTDLHLWRLGPGHLGAVISVATPERRDCAFYRSILSQFGTLSHVTVEVIPIGG